ncbi:MAG: DUF2723 domain-containing protein [Candidatus Eiseniibacteriota bacterium]
MHRIRKSLRAPLTVIAAALCLYLVTLCPTVYVSGTGENITACATLGVPHPPGFPLFCLLARLFVVALPVSPALAVNVCAATCMALAAGVLAWTVARWSGRQLGGLVAGLLFVVARTPWSQAVIGEVYGLSALLLTVQLALLLAWRGTLRLELGARDRARALLLFGLALGVGISVHPLDALMVPGYVALYVTAPGRRWRPRQLTAAALLALLGASLHLYTPLRSALDPFLDWGNPEGGRALVDYLTASQYRGRMFSLGATEIAGNLGRLATLLVEQWTLIGLVPVVAGIVALVARARRVALALGLMALLDVVYAVNYDIPWEIEVYYIPLVLLLALATGLLAAVLDGRQRMLLLGWTLLVVSLSIRAHGAEAGRRGVDLVERYGRDILDTLPAGAALITPPTNPTFVLLYLQGVEHARPDVQVYVAGGRGLSRLGEALEGGAGTAVTPLQLARRGGHPLYYAARDPLDDLPGYTLRADGPIYRAVPAHELHGDAPPPGAADRDRDRPATAPRDPASPAPMRFDPAEVDAADDFRLRLIAARYLLVRSDHAVERGDGAAAAAARDAARRVAGDRAEVLGALALRAAAEGDTAQAITDYEAALARREDAVLVNRLGRLRHASGDLAGAERAFRRAIAIEPELAVAHSNLGALLGSQGEMAEAARVLETAVALDPLSVMALNNLAMARLGLRDREAAAVALRRSLALDPAQPRVRALLAKIER